MLTPRSLVVLVGCLLSQAASAYTLTCSISNVDSSTFRTGDVTLTLTNNTGLGAIQPGKTIEVHIDSVNGTLIASVCSDKLLGRSNVYKLEGVIGADSKFGLKVGPCYTKVLTSNAACTADPAPAPPR